MHRIKKVCRIQNWIRAWNQAWKSAAHLALAELEGVRGGWRGAREHLEQVLVLDTEHLRARNLLAMVLRVLGCGDEAERWIEGTLEKDRLDVWARWLKGQPLRADLQTRLDLAYDLARAGFYREAIGWLTAPIPGGEVTDARNLGAWPMVGYTLAWLYERSGDPVAAKAAHRHAASVRPDHCFPARLDEIRVLEAAMGRNPRDARAPYYLGNLMYDRRRHDEAMTLWELGARLDPELATVWRNLGIGEYNVRKRARKARECYERAFRCDPGDARLAYERDQLWKRLGISPERRLASLEARIDLVERRDDLSLEFCALLNQVGWHERAERVLAGRRFQPWEGGEGQALGQHVRTQMSLGYDALARGDAGRARDRFESALRVPENLGEARHLLANPSDVHYALGIAWERLGRRTEARRHWRVAARFEGDFREMRVRDFSETTFYSALAWGKLGRRDRQTAMLRRLLEQARKLEKAPVGIDYFATSLPTLLLFDDDLGARQAVTALFLQAQACWGLGREARAITLARRVLRMDPHHGPALDFLRQRRFLA